jgi:hypothetical protein
MTRTNGLQKLLALREARLQRAHDALSRQHIRCETARADVEAATAQIVAHRDWQQEHERTLLAELADRPATLNQIERLRAAFAVIDEQTETLERAERDASQAMRNAFELKAALIVEHNRRRHEQTKMASLVARSRSATLRRRELFTEVEQEERVRSGPATDQA